MNQRKSASGAASSSSSRRGPTLRMLLAAAVLAIAPAGVVRAQKSEPSAGDGRPPASAKSLGERVADRLIPEFQRAWPDPPEWVAMLVDILKGGQLGPGTGWFKKA